MSSKTDLITAIGVSAALFLGGGWLASEASATAPEQNSAAAGLTPTLAPSTPAEAETGAAGLAVTIEGVRSTEGRVIVMVFDTEDAYAAYDFSAAAGWGEQAAAPGSVRFHFDGLTDGPYAIIAFHDADGDYDLAMDGVYPTEGYGGTGMARWYDEPDFAQAASARGETTIRLHYLQ